jgi:hypothetical protein
MMRRTKKQSTESKLLQRARQPSYKVPGLPNIRPCLECEEKRPIVARGLCDKCRKKEQRKEAGLNLQALGNKQTKETGTKLLAKLTELMGKAKLLRANRERVLQEFMPFLGFTPEAQRMLIRELTGPGVEDTKSSFTRVHSGSHMSPDDCEARKPM